MGGVEEVRKGEVAPAVRRSSRASARAQPRVPPGCLVAGWERKQPGKAAAHACAHRAKLRTSYIASFSGINFLLIKVCTTALCTSPYAPLAIGRQIANTG